MATISPDAAHVLSLARAGQIDAALAAGAALLDRGDGDAPFALFLGVLACRQGAVSLGLQHLRRAQAMAPADPRVLAELGRALLADNAAVEAAELARAHAGEATPFGREMQRILAQADLQTGNAAEARALFLTLTAADARDFESWEGLARAHLALGGVEDAVTAAASAVKLAPQTASYGLTLARAYHAADRLDEAAAAARTVIARRPDLSAAHLALARALGSLKQPDASREALGTARRLAGTDAVLRAEIGDVAFELRDFVDAEADYRAALAQAPALAPAWIGLATLHERMNRTDALLATLDDAEQAGVDPALLALLRARGLRAARRLEDALAVARSAGASDPVAKAQLIGDIADRLGDAELAFAHFSEANRLLAEAAVGTAERADAYRARYAKMQGIVTPDWYARWQSGAPGDGRADPLFIFGFPRSGTTLIDTMLSGHPAVAVYEEEPLIEHIAEALGPIENLPGLPVADQTELKRRYFTEAEEINAAARDRRIVDKNPLGLSSTPLLHRLFPSAQFVFVERHPCDVVLSCYITSTQMNANVAHFFDFAATARLYDAVLSFWTHCCEVLPIAVHRARYERLVEAPEAELRALAGFAGLDWTPQLLAHQRNASDRAYIGSPSYAQVAEPVYRRATGRWQRYRTHMAAAIPILEPWVERMGYSLD